MSKPKVVQERAQLPPHQEYGERGVSASYMPPAKVWAMEEMFVTSEYEVVTALTAEAIKLRALDHRACASDILRPPTAQFYDLIKKSQRQHWKTWISLLHHGTGLCELAWRAGACTPPKKLVLPDGTSIPNRDDDNAVYCTEPAAHYSHQLLMSMEHYDQTLFSKFIALLTEIENSDELPLVIEARYHLGKQLLAPVPVQYVVAGLEVHPIWLLFAARQAVKSNVSSAHGRTDFASPPFGAASSLTEAYAVTYVQEDPRHASHPRRVPRSTRRALRSLAIAQPNAYVWLDKVGTIQKIELQDVWGATANLLYAAYPVLVVPPLQEEVASVIAFPIRERALGPLLIHSKGCLDCLTAAIAWFRLPPHVSTPDADVTDRERPWLTEFRQAAESLLLRSSWDLVGLDSYHRCWPTVERCLGLDNCGLQMIGRDWTNLLGSYLLYRHLGAALRTIGNSNWMQWLERKPSCPQLFGVLGEGWCAPDMRYMAHLDDSMRTELACCTLIAPSKGTRAAAVAFAALNFLRGGRAYECSKKPLDYINTRCAVRQLLLGEAARAPSYDHNDKVEALAILRGILPIMGYGGVGTRRQRFKAILNYRMLETASTWGYDQAVMVPPRLLSRWRKYSRSVEESEIHRRVAAQLHLLSPLTAMKFQKDLARELPKYEKAEGFFDDGNLVDDSFTFSGLGILPPVLMASSLTPEEYSAKDFCVALCTAKAKVLLSLRCVGMVELTLPSGRTLDTPVMAYGHERVEGAPYEYMVLCDVATDEKVAAWRNIYRVSQKADFVAEIAAGRPGFTTFHPQGTCWIDSVGPVLVELHKTNTNNAGMTVNVVN